MRRFLSLGTSSLVFFSGLILAWALVGCGGKAVGPSVSITLTPATVSLSRGAKAQISVQALDVADQVVSAPALAFDCQFTNAGGGARVACSGPNAPITVSSTGLICAGQWDTDFITCQTTDNNNNLLPLGTASISAVSVSPTITLLRSSTVVVTDHEPIDSLQLVPDPANPVVGSLANPTGCFTEGTPNASTPNAGMFTAKAFSHDPAACQRLTGSPTVPCQVPDSTIGSINWALTPNQVGTLSSTTTLAGELHPVQATASTPGQGVVVASVGTAGSMVTGSAPFVTCPVASIDIQTSTMTNSFTAPVSATVTLTATVYDIQKILLDLTANTLGLSWFSSQPALANVALGTVNTAAPGTAQITAACLPPGCNSNFIPPLPVYSSSPVTATVTGTVDSTVLVTTATPPACASTVACTNFNNIVPIDTTTNAAGSPFTLPDGVQVNSMVIAPGGDPAFLGTVCADGTTGVNGAACSGLLRFDPTAGSTVPAPNSTIPGMALVTDGNHVVVSNPAQNELFIATSVPSVEAIPQINISSLIAGSGTTETGNTVAITTTAAHGFTTGQSVVIAGVGVAGYNGTFVVQSVPSSTTFTYTDAANSGLAPSGGGYATAGVAAALSPDGTKIYIVAGGNLYIYQTGLPLRTRSLNGLMDPNSTQAVSFFGNDSMAYIAETGGDDVVASCSDQIFSTVAVSGAPTHIASLPNATAMVDANSPNIDEIDVAANPADLIPYGVCPPDVTNSHHAVSFGTTFTPTQLIVTPDSTQALILADKGVLAYNLGTKQASVVQLSGKAQALTGGVTPDSASLYVGATDGTVHRVDLTKTPPVDVQNIPVSLCPTVATGCNPDFVVVRPVATVATLTSLTIAPLNATIGTGQNSAKQFTATGKFSDGTTRDMTNFVTWTSNNTVVAVIGPTTAVTPAITTPGLAQGLAAGSVTITASSAGVSASTTLTVN